MPRKCCSPVLFHGHLRVHVADASRKIWHVPGAILMIDECDGLAVVRHKDSMGFANRGADVACAWCKRWRGPLAKDAVAD